MISSEKSPASICRIRYRRIADRNYNNAMVTRGIAFVLGGVAKPRTSKYYPIPLLSPAVGFSMWKICYSNRVTVGSPQPFEVNRPCEYMAAIIEFALPADEFALKHTLTTLPGVEIEIERVVADASEQITPYMWVRADDFDAFEGAVRDDPTVEGMTLLSQTDDEYSYQMTWTGSIDFAVQLLTEHQGTITHAETMDTRWHLRVVFPDRETLSQAYDYIHDAGFQIDVEAIYATEDPRNIRYGLTDKQRDTMVAAFKAGYFAVPRDTTMGEFADQQELSHQAISEQLRRATGNLIESTLLTHSDEDSEGEDESE